MHPEDRRNLLIYFIGAALIFAACWFGRGFIEDFFWPDAGATEIPIVWTKVGASNFTGTAEGYDYSAYLAARPPSRVNILLALDGSNYNHTLARGVPTQRGTNVWWWSVPRSREYLTETARIKIEALKYQGADDTLAAAVRETHIDWSESTFTLSGCHIFQPTNGAVTVGSNVTVRWQWAGGGDRAVIGLSTNSGSSYGLIGYAEDMDSCGTNEWNWYVSGEDHQATGNVHLAIMSMTASNVVRTAGPITIQEAP